MSKNFAAEALVGGTVALALVEVLFDKGILSREETRNVLNKANRSLDPYMQTLPGALEAGEKITALLRGKLAERALPRGG